MSALVNSRVSAQAIVVPACPVVVVGQSVALLAGSLRLRQRDVTSAFTEADGSTSRDHLVEVTDGAGRNLAHPAALHIGDAVETEPRLQAAVLLWPAAAGFKPLAICGWSTGLLSQRLDNGRTPTCST